VSHSLVPNTPKPLAVPPSTSLAIPDLTPAVVPKTPPRVKPTRVVSPGDDYIQWFEKEDNGPWSKRKRTDSAMIVTTRGKSTFKLQYYPLNGEPQIVKELPMDQMDQAHLDLFAAGFGTEEQRRAIRTVEPVDIPLSLPAPPLSLT
jgi:hypothetical protein